MSNGLKMGARPSDFVDSLNALLYIINKEVDKVKTMILVRVVGVNTVETAVRKVDTIDVIPVIQEVDANNEAVPLDIIPNIKYIRWQFGNNAIKAVPAIGDIGIMIISKKDASRISINSGIVTTKREYCLQDGVYIGGLLGFNSEPTQFIDFTENGIDITSDKDLTINVKNATINASESASVISPVVNLGTDTGFGVARIGDSVDLITGKITTGSSIVKAG